MKILLTKIVRVAAMLAAGLSGSLASAAEGDTVASPAKRQETLDKAKALLAPHEFLAVTVDPFHPEGFAEILAGMGRGPATNPTGGGENPVRTTVPSGPRTNRDLLIALATALKSPNVMVLGGQPVLFFGQKRVKQGGTLSITFEGTEYTVEITDITRPNFTLRYNREEYTRPITIK